MALLGWVSCGLGIKIAPAHAKISHAFSSTSFSHHLSRYMGRNSPYDLQISIQNLRWINDKCDKFTGKLSRASGIKPCSHQA